MKHRKLFDLILNGRSDQNVPFLGLCMVLSKLGFGCRHKGGSHHIFTKQGIPEIVNLQPKNGKAKPYQVKQVREIIQRYGFTL